ncbi:hypothetical protein E2542_SST10575 [Spatholobus suberectus]|nr:hypothetical protein E2542_SST10575 [Spatholobus suberectus]
MNNTRRGVVEVGKWKRGWMERSAEVVVYIQDRAQKGSRRLGETVYERAHISPFGYGVGMWKTYGLTRHSKSGSPAPSADHQRLTLALLAFGRHGTAKPALTCDSIA